MKTKLLAAACAIFAAVAFADSADQHLQSLDDIIEQGLVDLTDSSLENCANFDGIWSGTCQVTIEDGAEILETTLQQNVTVAQTGCQRIAIDGEKHAIEVAVNDSYASQQGFKVKSHGVWWSEGGRVLGFASESQGMRYEEREHLSLKSKGEMREAKDGSVLISKEITVTKAGETEDSVPLKTKYSFDCVMQQALPTF